MYVSGPAIPVSYGENVPIRASPDSNSYHVDLPNSYSETNQFSAERNEDMRENEEIAMQLKAQPHTNFPDAYNSKIEKKTSDVPINKNINNNRSTISTDDTHYDSQTEDLKEAAFQNNVRRLSIDDNVAFDKPNSNRVCSAVHKDPPARPPFSPPESWPACAHQGNHLKKGSYDFQTDEFFASTARAETPPSTTRYNTPCSIGPAVQELNPINDIRETSCTVNDENPEEDKVQDLSTKNSLLHLQSNGNLEPHTRVPDPEPDDQKNPTDQEPSTSYCSQKISKRDGPVNERFTNLLRPVLKAFLSVPEAEVFRKFLDQPERLLEELVEKGGGQPSTESDPLQRMKINFKLFVSHFVSPETRSEWGWEEYAVEDILELLSSEAGKEYTGSTYIKVD